MTNNIYDKQYLSLLQAIFEIFQIWTNYTGLKRIPSPFPYVKQLRAIDHSFVTITELFNLYLFSDNKIKFTKANYNYEIQKVYLLI